MLKGKYAILRNVNQTHSYIYYWLIYGLANSINNSLRLKLCCVCKGFLTLNAC